MVGVGNRVEPATHLELGIVGHVVGTVRLAAKRRRNGGAREIIGVNVIGEHVVLEA